MERWETEKLLVEGKTIQERLFNPYYPKYFLFDVAITPEIKRPPFVLLHFLDISQGTLHYPIISHCASCPESLGCEITY